MIHVLMSAIFVTFLASVTDYMLQKYHLQKVVAEYSHSSFRNKCV